MIWAKDARGYITAYDLKTGKRAWRFYTVPGSPEKPYEHEELKWAAETWDPNSLWEAGDLLSGNLHA